MAEVLGWQGVAYNQATESDNRIHSDDVAKQYGFRGGLVPGVTVYAYLVHPAIEAWGLDWLARGTANVVLRKPLYDSAKFEVRCEQGADDGYRGRVIDEDGVLCADGSVGGPRDSDVRPVLRGDPPVPARAAIPSATRAALERLREQGLGSLQIGWAGTGEMDRYTRDLADIPDCVRPDRDGYANPAFTLGMANWVLARNVALGPWIHVQSDVRNLAAIPRASELVIEATITDLFERGGHEFVDLDVAIFIEPDTVVMAASHRAIYLLKPA